MPDADEDFLVLVFASAPRRIRKRLVCDADRPDRNGIVDRFQGTEVEVGFAVVRLLELQMHYLRCFHNPILVQIYRFSGVLPRFRARIDQSIGPTADIRKLAAFSFFFFRGTFFFFKG